MRPCPSATAIGGYCACACGRAGRAERRATSLCCAESDPRPRRRVTSSGSASGRHIELRCRAPKSPARGGCLRDRPVAWTRRARSSSAPSSPIPTSRARWDRSREHVPQGDLTVGRADGADVPSWLGRNAKDGTCVVTAMSGVLATDATRNIEVLTPPQRACAAASSEGQPAIRHRGAAPGVLARTARSVRHGHPDHLLPARPQRTRSPGQEILGASRRGEEVAAAVHGQGQVVLDAGGGRAHDGNRVEQ